MIDDSWEWECSMLGAISTDEGPTPRPGTDAPIPPRARRGTTVMEYVLILSLIVSVSLAGVGYFGKSNSTVSSGVSDSLSKSMNKGNGYGNNKGNANGSGKGKGNGKD